MKNITLVQGKYAPREAQEMLLTMVNSKINFHKLQNLSSEVCRFRPDEQAWDIVNYLTQAKEELLQLLEQAAQTNARIRIVTSVQLMVEEGETEERQPEEMLLTA